MAVAMVAMLAFGGTYAYFTSTAAAKTAKIGTGTILLQANSISQISTKAVSGTELLGKTDGTQNTVTVALDSTTDVDTWVFAIFSVSLTDTDGQTVEGATQITADTNSDSKLDEKDLGTTEGNYILDYAVDTASGKWVEVETGVYAFRCTAGAATEIPTLCSGITFYGYTNNDPASSDDGILMGKQINVSIESKAIQAEGFDTDYEAAYAAVKNIAATPVA